MLAWETVERRSRAYLVRNQYRLRPDMGVDDVIQEMYFCYRKCVAEVTKQSIADRNGCGVDEVSDTDLVSVQGAYMRRAVRSYVFTAQRSAKRKSDTVIAGTAHEPCCWASNLSKPFSQEDMELRIAVTELSEDARRVLLSRDAWAWKDGAHSAQSGEAWLRIKRLIRAEDPGPCTEARGRAVWAEIQNALGVD